MRPARATLLHERERAPAFSAGADEVVAVAVLAADRDKGLAGPIVRLSIETPAIAGRRVALEPAADAATKASVLQRALTPRLRRRPSARRASS